MAGMTQNRASGLHPYTTPVAKIPMLCLRPLFPGCFLLISACQDHISSLRKPYLVKQNNTGLRIIDGSRNEAMIVIQAKIHGH
jgi:hypothetical protein